MAKQTAKLAAKSVALDEITLRDVLSALRSNRDFPELPSELQRLLAAQPERIQEAGRHAKYALASVLGAVWRRRVRAALGIGRTDPRDWVAALIPVGQYLSPVLDDKIKLRADMASWQREDVIALLGDAEWVNSWLEDTQITEQVIKFGGTLDRDTYDTWRKKGLQMLLRAIQAEVAEPQTVSWVVPVSASMDMRLHFVPLLPDDYIECQAQRKLIELLGACDAMRALVVYGPVGIGKTTLVAATVCAKALEPTFDKVLWVDSSKGNPEKWLENLCGAVGKQRQVG